ncbi:KNR4/SMI1 homolog [Nicotiana tomentosiformis]|uniref:KNR4/SMI1 homolog n=1 Tax=Nicotiana tomentosiformis TaxID=4098 RepID=UPI00388C77EE
MIRQLREEVDIMKAETLGWKEGMDRLAVEKEAVRAQLSSAESQLQGMKERSSVQARKIEELEARLTFELAKAKSEAEKAKAEADAFVVVYRADAEAAQVQARKAAKTAQTRAYWIDELSKCQSRRETLEVIHARGFDLAEEIKKAKKLEAEARDLASDDDDDDDDSKSGSESREDLDGEEAAPRDNQEP